MSDRSLPSAQKRSCERCGEPLAGVAFACSYACTFCASCTQAMSHRCPNCGGALEPRLAVSG